MSYHTLEHYVYITFNTVSNIFQHYIHNEICPNTQTLESWLALINNFQKKDSTDSLLFFTSLYNAGILTDTQNLRDMTKTSQTNSKNKSTSCCA